MAICRDCTHWKKETIIRRNINMDYSSCAVMANVKENPSGCGFFKEIKNVL